MSRHLQFLRSSIQASTSKIRSLAVYLPISIRRAYTKQGEREEASSGSDHGVDELHHERAPSTAEEFKRVAEEKREAEEKSHDDHGFASQTLDKARDGVKEATTGDDSTFESVKEAHEEPPGTGDFPGYQ